MSPRVVIGVPLYNNAEHLPEALESLLMQTFRDYAVILVDDCSTDRTPKIAEHYGRKDDRVSYVRNDERLGMVVNWRKAFELARERHPEMEYFAWASDHDVWHPRWLASLVAVLDAEPEVVIAYPLSVGIDDDGNTIRGPWEFDTHGVTDRWERVSVTSAGMTAGSMVYSLFRADVLAECGVYRLVLLPDRLLMTELALHGQFRQVPEILWFRRYRQDVQASYFRQRAAFFPNGAPLYSFLPWSLVHFAVFAWSTVVRGSAPAGMGRGESMGVASRYLTMAVGFQLRRWLRHKAKAARRLILHRALPVLARPIGGERGGRIIFKAATRASDRARAAGSPAERAREIVRVAEETAGQLRRERARSSDAATTKESKKTAKAERAARKAQQEKEMKEAKKAALARNREPTQP
jgi:glycosyltransferase involved in cell wall biosynthesis